MKGLFIKDFKLLSMQKNFILLIIAIVFSMFIFGDDLIFPVGFMTFIASILAVSTISYDEFENGNAFLFTLPFSRKEYVLEKYCFGLLIGSLMWILSLSITIFVNDVREFMLFSHLLQASYALFVIMIFLQAIMYPFYLKFGNERGRIAIIISFAALSVLFIGIGKLFELFFGIDLIKWIDALPLTDIGVVSMILTGIALFALFISLKVSFSIVIHKEF